MSKISMQQMFKHTILQKEPNQMLQLQLVQSTPNEWLCTGIIRSTNHGMVPTTQALRERLSASQSSLYCTISCTFKQIEDLGIEMVPYDTLLEDQLKLIHQLALIRVHSLENVQQRQIIGFQMATGHLVGRKHHYQSIKEDGIRNNLSFPRLSMFDSLQDVLKTIKGLQNNFHPSKKQYLSLQLAAFDIYAIIESTIQTAKLKQREIICGINLAEDITISLRRVYKQLWSAQRYCGGTLISNRSYLAHPPSGPAKMLNPHRFLKTNCIPKHQLYLTKGVYEYFHYGDDEFVDYGWGCAYRALQTTLSWMILQGYLSMERPPTIPLIQRIIDMVNASLNAQKISGTRDWIGATEVSWVIEKLSGYYSKILHVRDGKQIMQHLQTFRQHFETVGCPIMFGGGQYAYSIVGLNYCWSLGECQFLILDPHYVGQDLPESILDKKGVVWRKPNQLFKPKVYYNFCLPILPPK